MKCNFTCEMLTVAVEMQSINKGKHFETHFHNKEYKIRYAFGSMLPRTR